MSFRYCHASTVHLRHISASGALDNAWEYDAKDRRVRAMVRAGSCVGTVDVEVCTTERPRIGAHPIKRVSEESWRIEAVRFVVEWPQGLERLRAIPCPIADAIGPGTSLTIAQAPQATIAHLEAL